MARLKIRRNQNDYFSLELEEGKVYKIGRKDGCDVVLQPDPGISREHLEIKQNSDRLWTVKNLSTHVPITDVNGSCQELICNNASTEFSISPYDFYLLQEIAPVQVTVQNETQEKEEHPDLVPSNSPLPVDEELSFVGSEEKTSDIYLDGDPYLKFMYSSHSESIRLKGNKWVAGRDPISQIALDDKKASRQHFSIEKVGNEFFIKDLKSANGTLLNGQELNSMEPQLLKSGDIITVNQLTMIFELRDLAFSEKLKDLPLQAYSGPMILSSQEWDSSAVPPQMGQSLPARPSTQELALISGNVEKLQKPKNTFRMVLLSLIAIIFVAAYFVNSTPDKPVVVDDGQLKNFEFLTPEKQKLVMSLYKQATDYFSSGKLETTILVIKKIHEIVPFYKDSKELETKCIASIDIMEQKQFVKRQLEEQEKTKKRVESIIADCNERFKDSVDLDAAKSCLKEASELDPENTEGQSLITVIETRINQAMVEEQKLKEYNDSVALGRDMFYKARNLLQNKDYQEAMNAFATHANSPLPDPDHLKVVSKRTVASIEKRITAQKANLMNKARYYIQVGNYRDAITTAEQAKLVDPYDYAIANFIEQYKGDLQNKMRNIYTNSVIEERFGNMELSKNLWKEIIQKDVPNGEYYLKALRKLQQYGLSTK